MESEQPIIITNSDAEEWLFKREPNFLNSQQEAPITGFMLIWSYFEGRYLGLDASARSIRQFVTNKKLLSSSIDIESFTDYFRERYTDPKSNTGYSYRYDYLNGEGYKLEDEIKQLFKSKKTISRETKFIGCLLIIYRFRNNLFHGRKWQNSIMEQVDNFSQSIKLLSDIMDFIPEPEN